MNPKYDLHGKTYLWRKVCLFIYTNIYTYYFKVHPNKILTCKVRGKIKLSALGITLNEGKLK